MWAWWLLLIIVVAFLLTKFRGKSKSGLNHWASKNVYEFEVSKGSTFYERWTYKLPFHVLIDHMYKDFKARGLRYGGLMEDRPQLVVMDLDLIKHIMVKDFDVFINRTEAEFGRADAVLNKMLIRLKDQEWKDLRTTISPTFSSGKIRRMYQIFNTSGEKMVEYLKHKVGSSTVEIECRDLMTRFTLDVISSSAFGLDSQSFTEKGSDFTRMANQMQSYSLWSGLMSMARLLFPKFFIFFGIPIRDAKVLEFFVSVVRNAIKQREETGEVRDDFLQLLIETQRQVLKEEAEEGESQLKGANKVKLTEGHILAQCLLFFFSGVDAVETMLMFACYSLACNPDVQETLFQEVTSSFERNGNKFDYESIMQMEYLEKFISEVMRVYPQGFRTPRVTSQAYKVPNSDLVLDKGAAIMVPVYSIHHDAEYFPNPEKFDPERFSTENKATRNPYAYMPFGVGPRNCIALRFALFEGKVAIAHLVQSFRLEPSVRTQIPVKFSTMKAMRPDGGVLYVSAKKR